MQAVKWGEYRLGDLFEIENTLSFNTDKLVPGNDYDYVTRTSLNQGILRATGFVNRENINPSGTWSLGLLQMDFFYRRKSWYAGQFVRKIIPKITIKDSSVLFFTTLLNKQKPKLLSVLVRDVDKVFCSTKIQLPTKNGEIDFDFMEAFVAELEAERVAELSAYLAVSGFDNYELSDAELNALREYPNLEFDDFDILDVFTVKNTSNLLSSDIVENSGKIPYLCASSENNGVSSYIEYNKDYLEEGNCIFIGGKTFVVSYQENDFFSNDSHNLALYLNDSNSRTKLNQLYITTCVFKSLSHKYSWGNSVSKAKIKCDKISLPVKNGSPDFAIMKTFISAIQKLVIRDVVDYSNRKINATKSVVSSHSNQ